MTCYRLARRKFADLSGAGAGFYGGRYNPPGIPAVYSSQSIALACLEVLVHIDKSEVPNDYVVMAIQFAGRKVYRAQTSLPDFGPFVATDFRNSNYYRPFLRVPSVIVPREYNYVLFPDAEGFSANVAWIEPLNFDRRLFALIGE